MTKSNLAVIPCEYRGSEGQFSPVFLHGMDFANKRGFIKYNLESSSFVVNLRDLRLAPEAFETNQGEPHHSFIPRENIEVWLSHDKTSCSEPSLDSLPLGSWWPGRVISIHEKFVHCEVLAPACQQAAPKLVSDLASLKAKLTVQAIVVDLADIRLPWNGKRSETLMLSTAEKSFLESRSFVSLEQEDVLHKYTMRFPEYLGEICNPEVNGNLLKFCGAPCLLKFEGQSMDNPSQLQMSIISGSSEAIRRASLLEIVHSSLLHEHLKVSDSKKKKSIANSVNGDGNFSEMGSRNFDDLNSINSADSLNPISPNDDASSSNLYKGESGINNLRPMVFRNLTSKITGEPIYEGSFKINPDLIGMIIGHSGSNISKARKIEGIREISVNEEQAIILGESKEACENAREILDIIEVEVPIPTEISPRIVGTGGENLRRLVEQSGVRKAFIYCPGTKNTSQKNEHYVEKYELNVTLNKSRHPMRQMNGNGEEKSEAEETFSAIYIIGTRTSINKMRILLEYQFDNWNELSELEGTRRTLQNELRKFDSRSGNSNGVGSNGYTGNRKKFYPTNNTNSATLQENGHSTKQGPASTLKDEDFPPPNSQPQNNNNRPTSAKNNPRKSYRSSNGNNANNNMTNGTATQNGNGKPSNGYDGPKNPRNSTSKYPKQQPFKSAIKKPAKTGLIPEENVTA